MPIFNRSIDPLVPGDSPFSLRGIVQVETSAVAATMEKGGARSETGEYSPHLSHDELANLQAGQRGTYVTNVYNQTEGTIRILQDVLNPDLEGQLVSSGGDVPDPNNILVNEAPPTVGYESQVLGVTDDQGNSYEAPVPLSENQVVGSLQADGAGAVVSGNTPSGLGDTPTEAQPIEGCDTYTDVQYDEYSQGYVDVTIHTTGGGYEVFR